MIFIAGFLYLILSSVYTFSYAKKVWPKNKAASIGAVLLVFVSAAAAIIAYLRT